MEILPYTEWETLPWPVKEQRMRMWKEYQKNGKMPNGKSEAHNKRAVYYFSKKGPN